MTATEFEQDIQNDFLFIEDFDESILCELYKSLWKCDNEAKYRCTTKCCSYSLFSCEDCLFRAIEAHKAYGEAILRCRMCSEPRPANPIPFDVSRL